MTCLQLPLLCYYNDLGKNLSSLGDFGDLSLVNGVALGILVGKGGLLKSNYMILAGDEQLDYKHLQA